MAERLATPPPVPTTCIYSKGDGIVAWQSCVQRGGWPQVENVQVRGSHCGLGWNREVLGVVADRLRAPATGRPAGRVRSSTRRAAGPDRHPRRAQTAM